MKKGKVERKYKIQKMNYLKDMLLTGDYEIPVVNKQFKTLNIDKIIPFNYFNTCKRPKEYYLHFYIDDYQFERVYSNPDKYIEILSKFKGVIGPDFSVLSDMPLCLQIYNDFRNKFLMAYFQSKGIKVIPNVTWGDCKTYNWCFDGLPKQSLLAICSNGCLKKLSKELFIQGFNQMVKVLQPTQIICIGKLPIGIQVGKQTKLTIIENSFTKGGINGR